MKFKSSSLTMTVKEYVKHFPEDIEDYVFSHLNDDMKKVVDVFSTQSPELAVALIPAMTDPELEKLGEYLIENRLIHEYKWDFYFEIPEKIHYEGAIFNC